VISHIRYRRREKHRRADADFDVDPAIAYPVRRLLRSPSGHAADAQQLLEVKSKATPTRNPSLSKMAKLRNAMLEDHELQSDPGFTSEMFNNLVEAEAHRKRQPTMRILRDQLLHDPSIQADPGFVEELNWHTLKESEAAGGAISGSRISNPVTGAFSRKADVPLQDLAQFGQRTAQSLEAIGSKSSKGEDDNRKSSKESGAQDTSKVMARLADELLHDPAVDSATKGELIDNIVAREAGQKDASVMNRLQQGLMHDPDIMADKGFMGELRHQAVLRRESQLGKDIGREKASGKVDSRALLETLQAMVDKHCQ
jgi:hypothetical protein